MLHAIVYALVVDIFTVNYKAIKSKAHHRKQIGSMRIILRKAANILPEVYLWQL